MNYRLVQSYLDRAAEEMDDAGFRDLADKIDTLNVELKDAEVGRRQEIAAELGKIDREVARRKGTDEDKEKEEDKEVKSSRLAALRRRMAIRRRLKAKMAERAEKAQGGLARARRMARLAAARRSESE